MNRDLPALRSSPSLAEAVRASTILAGRAFRRSTRSPQAVLLGFLQPVTQLLLFAYIFPSVVSIPGEGSYTEYVVPGAIAQAMVFVALTTGIGIAYELDTGMVGRLRSLPISRSSYLLGHVLNDGLRLAIEALFLTVISVAIGFTFIDVPFRLALFVAVLTLFGMSMTVIGGLVAFHIQRPEMVQTTLIAPLLPIVFTSSAYVPIAFLPSWLQPIARLNPITSAVDTARGIAIGSSELVAVSGTSLSTASMHFAIWMVAIFGIGGVLAVRRYKRRV